MTLAEIFAETIFSHAKTHARLYILLYIMKSETSFTAGEPN